MHHCLPAIALIYMGGTFGCTGQPLLPLPAEIFLPRLQQLLQGRYPALQCFVASKHVRDSSQLTPQDWPDLLHQIQELVGQGFKHILIVHGSDTLAYTAAFLAQFIHAGVTQPVQLVVTGSQYPLLARDGAAINPQSDALANLSTAYQQLCGQTQSSQQLSHCWVAFDGQVWPAHSVQKIHTSSTPAFSGSCIASGPADSAASALAASGPAASAPAALLKPAAFRLEALLDLNIAVYYALPLPAETGARQLQQIMLSRPHAVIIMAFGAGNLPRHAAVEAVLQQAQQAGILVILSTQVPFGGVNFNYAAGHWLAQFGVLSAGHCSLPAIYARLAWLLCQPLSFQQRQQQWQQY